IDGSEHRAFAPSFPRGSSQLQTPPCDTVEEKDLAGPVQLQPPQVRQTGFQRLFEIKQDGAGRAQADLVVVKSKSLESLNTNMPLQRLAGRVRIELPIGTGGDSDLR